MLRNQKGCTIHFAPNSRMTRGEESNVQPEIRAKTDFFFFGFFGLILDPNFLFDALCIGKKTAALLFDTFQPPIDTCAGASYTSPHWRS